MLRAVARRDAAARRSAAPTSTALMGCRLDSGIRRTCDAGVADRPTGSRPFSRQQRVAGLESRQIHSRPNGRWYLLKAEAGGESGIRTHGRVSPTHAFQACSFNHSDISPFRVNDLRAIGRQIIARRRSFRSVRPHPVNSMAYGRRTAAVGRNCVRPRNLLRLLRDADSAREAGAVTHWSDPARLPSRNRSLTVVARIPPVLP